MFEQLKQDVKTFGLRIAVAFGLVDLQPVYVRRTAGAEQQRPQNAQLRIRRR